MTGQIVPDQQQAQWRQFVRQGEANRQTRLPRLPHTAVLLAIERRGDGRQRRHDLGQPRLQPGMHDRVRAAGHRLEPHLPACGMEQRQHLGRTATHILVGLPRRLALRPPAGAGMRHGLEGAGLVRTPDRQTERSTKRVRPLDQGFFPSASGSWTTTGPPRLRLRKTTPVSHQVRLCCQLRPAACSVFQIV